MPAAAHDGDYGALATTRRQLRLLCAATGTPEAVLAPLAGPQVVHFCGHIVAAPEAPGRFAPASEAAVAAEIARAVEGQGIGYAYGALAAGADLLWAEALLAAGAELHVVLPFGVEEFVAASVAPAGPGWVDRFHACLARAAGITYGTEDAVRGDDALFRYGTELAMGLALARARYLDAAVLQLAVWDGAPTSGDAGTAIDVASWRAGGRTTVVVDPGPPAAAGPLVARTPAAPGHDVPPRLVRGLLFGDVKGFSKLPDDRLPAFASEVLGAFATVVERYGDAVEHRNTWGDAIYLVIRDVGRAAHCALELQEAMDGLDLEAAGLPSHLALRLGAHLGPVFPLQDPVLGLLGFMGSHVSRTARIEPITPPGEVYVTEPFAAAMAFAHVDELGCDYVGHLPAAKDYGSLRMHRLRRSTAQLAHEVLPR